MSKIEIVDEPPRTSENVVDALAMLQSKATTRLDGQVFKEESLASSDQKNERTQFLARLEKELRVAHRNQEAKRLLEMRTRSKWLHNSTYDERLALLQEYYRDKLPAPLATWQATQAKKHAAALAELQKSSSSDGKRRWHGQWEHNCTKQETEAVAGPIPRHFHFVFFLERGAWVNWTQPFSLISRDSPEYNVLKQEEKLLIDNSMNSLVMNEAESVHFHDTEACEHATSRFSDEMLKIYQDESDLRYRADICRVAAMYWEGGYFFDDDMLSYQPLYPLVHDDADFASVVALDRVTFFNSLIAVTPCHPVMRRNAEMLIEARRPNPDKKYDNLLGPVTLKLAYEEMQPRHSQLFDEIGVDPQNKSYESPPLLQGRFDCGIGILDKDIKKVIFCSRF